MKKNRYNDIGDDEIRIIGDETPHKVTVLNKWWIIGILVAIIAVVAIVIVSSNSTSHEADPEVIENVLKEQLEQSSDTAPSQNLVKTRFGREVDSLTRGFCQIRDTMINDVPLRIYIPHNAEMSLHIGKVDKSDESIIYVAEAAFIREDNGKILGAFVLNGEPKAWGLSMHGYCASINGVVTVGVANDTPLFEKATQHGGHFFRQYPLIDNGVLVENAPKNKSIRRAICQRNDETFMVESQTKESFHDFSQALVDLGIDNAVNIAGSLAYGWAVDEEGTTHEFGSPNFYNGRKKMPKNTNYMVWRRTN